ncbi:hypothetical protein [Agromyces sp. GXQ0307]|uniref:hypothetical protein n=1 Tax=Agromyces sp. GXQ0307 TaxID=3377835 RepID=UPI00383B3FF6
MAGFWAGRRRGARELEARGAADAKRVGSALFAADEQIRVAAEELAFAEAVLGADDAAARTAALVIAARDRLNDAFRLDRLNRDAMPGAADEIRARTQRILQVCEWIERTLDEQVAALGERMSRARRAPEAIAGLRADVERLRERVPHARATVARLSARYAREALADVASGPSDAAQQLGFAEHTLAAAERRCEIGDRDEMLVALEASARSVQRAEALLDAVDGFEVEALRAEAELGDVVRRAPRELAAALAVAPQSRAVADATAGVEAALAALPAAGVDTDPIGHLARLRDALAVLADAVAGARERASRPAPPARHVHDAVADADRQLDLARDAVAGHPGRIGAAAVARLAESERLRLDLGHCLGSPAAEMVAVDVELRVRVIELARRAAALAAEAVQLARSDLASSRALARTGT